MVARIPRESEAMSSVPKEGGPLPLWFCAVEAWALHMFALNGIGTSVKKDR